MNILVTGAGGFLGSAIVEELIKKGHKVRTLLRRKEAAFNLHGMQTELFICDILNSDAVMQAVKGIDVIFHAAAIYNTYPWYCLNPKELYTTNIEGTRNIMEAALREGVKKVIYTSSTAAVGKREDGAPADETVKLNLLEKRSHYEKSKAKAEEVALSYHNKGVIESRIIL
ncbi:NAD-dependent epimerase/dehydratase [Candidatus Omnitrophus magneticus]|uniref:NAD-dependent epimerase/dehydratase n=1 Tax=Candidatus Omnitrophus magneticus TaxID=1609969 RepID=A0A0F0CT41_9BACT|nr:NAD-dependent epimerase/dehydratase [Candidatus Omnitrophus magneticus]